MIIGREKEIATLQGLLGSDESQFVAVYGRRRVGKTFLIREAYNYDFVFQHTGTYGATRKQQLSDFRESLYNAGMGKCTMPKTWSDAFHLLWDFLKAMPIDGKKNKEAIYQLIDNYTLFYFDSICENVNGDEHFWTSQAGTSIHAGWAGRAFERVCMQHVNQINRPADRQKDDTINLCEMKYTNAEYTITEDEDEKIRNRKEAFVRETETEKTVLLTMITSFGLTHGGYSSDIHCQLTMADLFR